MHSSHDGMFTRQCHNGMQQPALAATHATVPAAQHAPWRTQPPATAATHSETTKAYMPFAANADAHTQHPRRQRRTAAAALRSAMSSAWPWRVFSPFSPAVYEMRPRPPRGATGTRGSITPRFCRLLKRSRASIGAGLSFRRLPVISSVSSTCARPQNPLHVRLADQPWHACSYSPLPLSARTTV